MKLSIYLNRRVFLMIFYSKTFTAWKLTAAFACKAPFNYGIWGFISVLTLWKVKDCTVKDGPLVIFKQFVSLFSILSTIEDMLLVLVRFALTRRF